MSKVDLSNFNQRLIIAGMAGLIDEGLTPHEVFEVLENIKRNTFHALVDIHAENKSKET